MPRDPEAWADAVVDAIELAIAPMRERLAIAETHLATLQHTPPVAGRDGRDGLPGVPGEPGTAGRDGIDGLGIDDLTVLHDGERLITFRWAHGTKVKEATIEFPVQIYRGVYTEGRRYARCDSVTWAGSEWYCTEPTTTKPGDGAKAWILKVKKGRDARDLTPVKAGS